MSCCGYGFSVISCCESWTKPVCDPSPSWGPVIQGSPDMFGPLWVACGTKGSGAEGPLGRLWLQPLSQGQLWLLSFLSSWSYQSAELPSNSLELFSHRRESCFLLARSGSLQFLFHAQSLLVHPLGLCHEWLVLSRFLHVGDENVSRGPAWGFWRASGFRPGNPLWRRCGQERLWPGLGKKQGRWPNAWSHYDFSVYNSHI